MHDFKGDNDNQTAEEFLLGKSIENTDQFKKE